MSSVGVTIIGTAVLGLLLAGYIGQRYIPPPKPRIVGIDLGTTYSCIGAYHAVTGQVDIIANSKGQLCIPSVVAYRENGEVLVGYDAVNQADHNPLNTFYDAKRFIGKVFTSEELEKEAERYPFRIFLDASDNNRVKFSSSHHPDNHLSAEDIGSEIISDLRKSAEVHFESLITMAVISVPAEFNQQQRQATKRAAKLAGIEVIRIINEPTAAALAYGLHNKTGVQDVLVVDLGGGTLDVSLLDIQGGMFLTRAMAGNNHLGGQDFNERLKNYLLQQINNKFQQELQDAEDMQLLRSTVEMIKLSLTSQDSAVVDIQLNSLRNNANNNNNNNKNEKDNSKDNNNNDEDRNNNKNNNNNKPEDGNIEDTTENIKINGKDKMFENSQKSSTSSSSSSSFVSAESSPSSSSSPPENSNNGTTTFRIEISKREFENINRDLFDKVLEPIRLVLEAGELEIGEVEDIVMVGGSTRIPMVRQIVSEYFGGKILNVDIDPELAVITGVATQAGIVGGAWPLSVSAVEVSSAVKKLYVK